MITPEIKDRFLSELVEHDMRGSFTFCEFANDLKISEDEFDVIMRQFEELNLVKFVRTTRTGKTLYVISADGVDFLKRGGFVAKESSIAKQAEIRNLELQKLNIEFQKLQIELEKLNLEIETLRKSAPKKAESMTGIVANLFSIVKTITSFTV